MTWHAFIHSISLVAIEHCWNDKQCNFGMARHLPGLVRPLHRPCNRTVSAVACNKKRCVITLYCGHGIRLEMLKKKIGLWLVLPQDLSEACESSRLLREIGSDFWTCTT